MTDTYPLVPNRISKTKVSYNTTIVAFESGYEQRLANHSKPIYEFELLHVLMNQTTLNTLLDFFKEKKGSFQKFYFVNHVDGVTYECKFADDAFSIDHVNAKFFNVSVRLQTC